MVVVRVKDKEFYLDGNLKKNYDFIKEKVLGQKDMALIIVDGLPGSGKSTAMSQGMFYLTDGNMTLDNCHHTIDGLSQNLINAKKGNGEALDEGFEINKRQTQSLANMRVLSLLQRVRCKQIFVFICLPMFYDLDKNIILGLANVLIHCYRQDFGQRGQFAVYNREGIKKLWLFGRQTLTYSEKIVKPNFRGRFTKFFAFDEQEYDNKKDTALEIFSKKKDERGNSRYKKQRDDLICKAFTEKKYSVKELIDKTGLGQRAIYNILEEHNYNNKEDKNDRDTKPSDT